MNSNFSFRLAQPSEPLSKNDAQDQYSVPINEVHGKLRRDFPRAGLKRVLGAESYKRFGTVLITIFDTWRNEKFTAVSPIANRNRIRRKISVAERVLGDLLTPSAEQGSFPESWSRRGPMLAPGLAVRRASSSQFRHG